MINDEWLQGHGIDHNRYVWQTELLQCIHETGRCSQREKHTFYSGVCWQPSPTHWLAVPQRWMAAQQHITDAAFPDRGDVWLFVKAPTGCQRLNSGEKKKTKTKKTTYYLSQRDTHSSPWLSLSLSLSRGALSVDDITCSENPPADQSASSCWVAKRIASAATVATKLQPLACWHCRGRVGVLKVKVLAGPVHVLCYFTWKDKTLHRCRWVALNLSGVGGLKSYKT